MLVRFSSPNYPNQYPKRNKNRKNLASKMGFSLERIKGLELKSKIKLVTSKEEKDHNYLGNILKSELCKLIP